MLVWCAGLVSWLGNYALFIALPVYVYETTGSTLTTAVSVMAGALPRILVSQVAGVLVDRSDYRRTLLFANLTLCGATLSFLPVLGGAWWALLPVIVIQASLGEFLGPAENALLPLLVSEKQLASANSLNALNNYLARLFGPVLGGFLLAFTGFEAVIVMDALSYALAALLLIWVKAPLVKRKVALQTNPYQRWFAEWTQGLCFMRSSPLLTLSLIAVALVGLGEGFISTLLVPFVEIMLAGGGLELGYIFSAQALGGVVGGFLLTAFADRVRPERLLAWGGVVSGVLLLAIFTYPLLYPVLWLAFVLTALAGIPLTLWNTAQLTLLQTESAPELRGRVFSAYFAMFSLTQLVGMGLSGYLGERVGVWVIGVDAVTYLLSGLVAVVVMRRRREKG